MNARGKALPTHQGRQETHTTDELERVAFKTGRSDRALRALPGKTPRHERHWGIHWQHRAPHQPLVQSGKGGVNTAGLLALRPRWDSPAWRAEGHGRAQPSHGSWHKGSAALRGAQARQAAAHHAAKGREDVSSRDPRMLVLGHGGPW